MRTEPLPLRMLEYEAEYRSKAHKPAAYTGPEAPASFRLHIQLWDDTLYLALPPDWEISTLPADYSISRTLLYFIQKQQMFRWEGCCKKAKHTRYTNSDRQDICLWKASVFHREPHGKKARPTTVYGMDNGDNELRRAFEQALCDWFIPLRDAYRLSHPGSIKTLRYTVGGGLESVVYTLETTEDDRLQLGKTEGQGKQMQECVHPELLQRLDALFQPSLLAAWHTFRCAELDPEAADFIDLKMLFDSAQPLVLSGNLQQPGGVPPLFGQVAAALPRLLDHALGLDGEAIPLQSPITSFHFDAERGLEQKSNEPISYTVYRRLNAEGQAEMALHLGWPDEDVVLDAAALQELAELCHKHQLANWNGFASEEAWSYARAFALHIVLADGTEITAHSSDQYPQGYKTAMHEIIAFFEQYLVKKGMQRTMKLEGYEQLAQRLSRLQEQTHFHAKMQNKNEET